MFPKYTPKSGEAAAKSKSLLLGVYTTPGAIIHDLNGLKARGWKVTIKGKGTDRYFKLEDGQ